MRESRDEARDHDREVAARHRGDRIADAERQDQADRQLALGQPSTQRDDDRCADDDTQGVRRDDVAGRRVGPVDAVGDLLEQAHRHELGRPDREPAEGKREQGERQVRGAHARLGESFRRGHHTYKSPSGAGCSTNRDGVRRLTPHSRFCRRSTATLSGMHEISEAERRARLGRRHALAHRAPSGHRSSTRPEPSSPCTAPIPATTVLSALARTRDAAAGRRRAGALRRPRASSACWRCGAPCSRSPATSPAPAWPARPMSSRSKQRRLLLKSLAEAGIVRRPRRLGRSRPSRSRSPRSRQPARSPAPSSPRPTRFSPPGCSIGSGSFVATPTVASRLLTLLSAEGKRRAHATARQRGRRPSSVGRPWPSWCDLGERLTSTPPITELARRWLHAYGPATLDDLQWWTGWTKTRTRAAVGAARHRRGRARRPTRRWSSPTTSTRSSRPSRGSRCCPRSTRHRWGGSTATSLLGPHRERLFDVNGNAGPTVWVDGRIVGGWAQRDEGEVAFSLLQDVGAEADRSGRAARRRAHDDARRRTPQGAGARLDRCREGAQELDGVADQDPKLGGHGLERHRAALAAGHHDRTLEAADDEPREPLGSLRRAPRRAAAPARAGPATS